MDYLQLSFASPPPLLFAHGYRTAPNAWSLHVNPRHMEITFIEQGALRFVTPAGTKTLSPGLHCLCHDRECRVISEEPVHQHYTFLLALPEPPVRLAPGTAPYGPAADYRAILPETVTEPALCSDISRDIKALIAAHADTDDAGRLKTGYLLLKILCRLHTYSLERGARPAALTPGIPYCRKAIQYIHQHLEEKIAVQDIAAALGISYGHLSRLMRAYTGMTLVDYIHQLKLEHVKELLLSKDLSLEEAGSRVGISDVKYLSRLFKKQNGITVTEFRKIHNNAY